jgi:threonylcarbamoyladenosine tRNA methylthiotransferase MtaB
MKVFLDSVGCRLNQAEIEIMARQFRAAGHEIVERPAMAELAVINTCAVTSRAGSDSRGMIRRIASAGELRIVATGCWATLQAGSAAALAGVSRVVSNVDKDRLVADLLGVPPHALDLQFTARLLLPGGRRRTRAFIKVQDGCNNRCTFCVTALARGRGRSRTLPDVVRDAQAALDGGTKEIVLTGVHLGSWGRDLGLDLKYLVRGLLAETVVPRLHLSSLEPWDLDEAFFSLWEDPRLCRLLAFAAAERLCRNAPPHGAQDVACIV